jgi:N-glycosylase/DNA lyase
MITSGLKLHDTVIRVSREAQFLLPEMRQVNTEDKLLKELILCILSSQEKYEVALSLIKKMIAQNIINQPNDKSDVSRLCENIKFELSQPVSFFYNGKQCSRRLRFFDRKGDFIVSSIQKIYFNGLTLRKILATHDNVDATRRMLIEHTGGLGPKQASMFLRNVGYDEDLAILDKHVIDFMKLMGLTDIGVDSVSSLKTYKQLETKLRSYAELFNIRLLHLDLAIWTTMRTLKTVRV